MTETEFGVIRIIFFNETGYGFEISSSPDPHGRFETFHFPGLGLTDSSVIIRNYGEALLCKIFGKRKINLLSDTGR